MPENSDLGIQPEASLLPNARPADSLASAGEAQSHTSEAHMSESDASALDAPERDASALNKSEPGLEQAIAADEASPKSKKPKRIKFSTRTPLPFDLPYRQYYAKAIPVMQTFRSALLQHYATDSAQNDPLKRGLRRLGDLISNSHSHLAAECGVYRGSSLVACAEIVRQYGLDAHIYGLDSFAGLPDFSNIDKEMAADLVMDVVREKGNVFDDTSLVEVQTALDERELNRYATLVPGFFSKTLPTLPEGPYFFINIDCDLYEGHLECLEFFYPKMEKGGIVFLDDYYSVHYPMAKIAVDTFMKGRSEDLFHIRYGPERENYTKAFFVKH